jgi:hypothetical protein
VTVLPCSGSNLQAEVELAACAEYPALLIGGEPDPSLTARASLANRTNQDRDRVTRAWAGTTDASGLPAAPQIGVGHKTLPFFASGNLGANTDYQYR